MKKNFSFLNFWLIAAMKKGGGKSGTSGGSGGEGSPAAKSKIPKLLKTSPTASPTIQRKTTTQNGRI